MHTIEFNNYNTQSRRQSTTLTNIHKIAEIRRPGGDTFIVRPAPRAVQLWP